MRVVILDDDEREIWGRGENKGVSNKIYVENGIQEKIIDLLEYAKIQAIAELCSNNSDAMSDICGATT